MVSLYYAQQEELSFYFTEELSNDGTPETVYLQKNDEIIVRRRRKPLPVCVARACPPCFDLSPGYLSEHQDIQLPKP